MLERLEAGEILISDGAAGTYLQARGLPTGDAPETWNFSHPDVVRAMAEAYFAAGSDLVVTNSFGGNRFRLERSGLGDRVVDVNRTAAELARSGAPGGGFVLGSVGPTGELLEPLGTQTPDTFHDAYAEQAEALARGGVDGFCVETMMAVEEAVLAVGAAKESTGLPVLATMTFEQGPCGLASQMGVTVAVAVEQLVEAGADVVGANCGNGAQPVIQAVREMRPLTDRPIMAQPNAGVPVLRDGGTVYVETPEGMATSSRDLVAEGAAIVGGCCGTGPDHISAIARAVRGCG